MNRDEFERLRDDDGKVIRGDLRFVPHPNRQDWFFIKSAPIENRLGVDARLDAQVNARTGSKIFNVSVGGVGAVCRLCLDAVPHGALGRTHKHAFLDMECVADNLARDVRSMPELAGLTIRRAFEAFCGLSHLRLEGELFVPDEIGGAA